MEKLNLADPNAKKDDTNAQKATTEKTEGNNQQNDKSKILYKFKFFFFLLIKNY